MEDVYEPDRHSDPVGSRVRANCARQRGVVARYLGFADERTADLQLAVSEAVTNAIEHGNRGRSDVQVGVHFILQRDRLAIRVIDQGGAMPELPPLDPIDLENKLAADSTRGLGIYLIQQLVDGVELQSGAGQTEFTMWFNVREHCPRARSTCPLSTSLPTDVETRA